MVTLKQKQTAANKILRINYPTYRNKKRIYFSDALVDNEGNQYYFCDYMGVKTSEKIIDEQDLKQIDIDTNYSLNNYLKNYAINIDNSKYKKIKCNLKELKKFKKWSRDNELFLQGYLKYKIAKIYLYDFNLYDDIREFPIVNIDYLIILLTIIDDADIYITNNEKMPVILKNKYSIGVLLPCTRSKKTAEIFAKRNKEFTYVE